MEGEGEGRGMGREGGVLVNESIFMSTLSKIQEAYTWLENKVNSFFKLLSESITKALLGLKSFLTSCCEKLREVFSWFIITLTQLDNSNGKKTGVTTDDDGLGGEMKREGPVHVPDMKVLIQKMRRSTNQWLGTGNSPEMKTAHQTMTWLLDLSEKLIKLLACAREKPLLLILRILDAFLTCRSNMKNGRLAKDAGLEGKTAMDIFVTVISLLPPTLNTLLY